MKYSNYIEYEKPITKRGALTMKNIKEFILTQVRKRWWILLILVLLIMILPSRRTISEDFIIYDYSDSHVEKYNLQFDIVITKHSKIPLFSKKVDVLFQIDDRKYRYMASNFPNRDESYIPLDTGIYDFGVILPNGNFSEFVILFDENHHFEDSNNAKFAVYPHRSEAEAIILLNELLEETEYDIKSRPMN